MSESATFGRIERKDLGLSFDVNTFDFNHTLDQIQHLSGDELSEFLDYIVTTAAARDDSDAALESNSDACVIVVGQIFAALLEAV